MSDRVIECPAFVDTHSHDDLALLTDPGRSDKRNQGIGAQVIGNCGISPFPAMPDSCQPVKRLFDAVMGPQDAPFPSVKDYRRKIARDDIVILQGYNALRASMFGPEPRRLDAAERKKISAAASQAIDEGAAGISFGLAYLPAVGADMDELVEVARQTPLVTVHLRNESSGILESIDEALDVARRARCCLHISHVKISGRAYWNKAELLFKKLRAAHEEIGVTFDHYPYSYGCTALAAVLPPEIGALSAGEIAQVRTRDFERRYEDSNWENYTLMCGWEGLKLAALEKYAEYNMQSIGAAAGHHGLSPPELVLRLVREESHPAMLVHSQDENIINELLKLPFGCVGTDGLPTVRDHPRLTDTFPEYLRRCRAAKLSAEDAVEKAAVMPRRIFQIPPTAGGTIRFSWSTGEIVSPPSGPETSESRKRSR